MSSYLVAVPTTGSTFSDVVGLVAAFLFTGAVLALLAFADNREAEASLGVPEKLAPVTRAAKDTTPAPRCRCGADDQ